MMGANADTIWQVPAYLPYLQAPLTDEILDSAEKQIGYRLPFEYVALLRRQNGGYIRYSLPGMVHDCISGIGSHYPSLTDFDWKEYQDDVSFHLHGLVPFDGDGHWYLCLDYRRNVSAPAVTYVDIESDYETGIADSFSGYLEILKLDFDDSDYVLEDVSDIDIVKSQLSSVVSVKWYPPDSNAHGYPEHRGNLGTDERPMWVWISPNTVLRGFVRLNEPGYSQMKDLMPGYAARFPELPTDSYLISGSSDLINAVKKLNLVVRPLHEYIEMK